MFKGITGDIHRNLDIHRLWKSSWYLGSLLCKDDLLFVAGDFGLVLDGAPKELNLREQLHEQPWTTVFVEGNHDNHEELRKFPIEERWGGKVSIINPSIIWLRRGEVYEIDYEKIFVFGGAQSVDKWNSLPGMDWWPQEIPSREEFDYALSNLDKHNWEVDYVISHTCPHYEVETFCKKDPLTGTPSHRLNDPTTFMLQEIKDRLKFKHWVFGHFHIDKTVGRFTCLYKKIVQLDQLGKIEI